MENQHSIEKQFYSVNAAATYLDVTTRTIFNYIESGKLTKYKLKRQTLLEKNQVHSLAIPRPEEAA